MFYPLAGVGFVFAIILVGLGFVPFGSGDGQTAALAFAVVALLFAVGLLVLQLILDAIGAAAAGAAKAVAGAAMEASIDRREQCKKDSQTPTSEHTI